MDFIDRTEELARLVRIAKESKGGFVVLWGRRRVGKSELLKVWCRRVGGLYTVADRSSAVIQRQNFASVVATVFRFRQRGVSYVEGAFRCAVAGVAASSLARTAGA